MTPNEFTLIGSLLAKIEYWSTLYNISFQFWDDDNNVYISCDLVDIHSMGGRSTMREILEDTIEWCEKTNPSKKYPKVITITNVQS